MSSESNCGYRHELTPELRQEVKNITNSVNQHVQGVARNLNELGAGIVGITLYPERMSMLVPMAEAGVPALIIGGGAGEQQFSQVDQIGFPGFASGETEESLYNFVKMANSIPDGFPRNIVVNEYEPMGERHKMGHEFQNLADLFRLKGLNVIGEASGNLKQICEEKTHLKRILELAGVEAHAIPSETVKGMAGAEGDTEQELRRMWSTYANFEGQETDDIFAAEGGKYKLVVQSCGEGVIEAGGGRTTVLCRTYSEFADLMRKSETNLKVAKFIDGQEANLSFVAGNTLPSETGMGAKRARIPKGVDVYAQDAPDALLAHGQSLGLNEDNIVVIGGRATVKVVGDPVLTSEDGNGVGNDLSFVYDADIHNQITEIASKVGRTMALMGKVGLAGCDLIIDRQGHVYINEINDRQQGPTALMSADARRAGIPGLTDVAWMMHFANYEDPSVQSTLGDLRRNSAAITDMYGRNPDGNWYAKANAYHGPALGAMELQQSFEPGLYEFRAVQGEDGAEVTYTISRAGDATEDAPVVPEDITAVESFLVEISGTARQKGQMIKPSQQMFRLIGTGSSPYEVVNGKSRVKQAWRPVFNSMYTHLMGEGYVNTNPKNKRTNN